MAYAMNNWIAVSTGDFYRNVQTVLCFQTMPKQEKSEEQKENDNMVHKVKEFKPPIKGTKVCHWCGRTNHETPEDTFFKVGPITAHHECWNNAKTILTYLGLAEFATDMNKLVEIMDDFKKKQAEDGANINGFQKGHVVNYHSIIDGKITSGPHTIKKVGKLGDEPVAWITGKSSCISLRALSFDNRKDRILKVNQFIEVIASTGRKFFREGDDVSYFGMDDRSRLWFIDKYPEMKGRARVFLHNPQSAYDHITEGGTLKHLVIKLLKPFILKGETIPAGNFGPWVQDYCQGDLWGYGESMQEVREAALILGIINEIPQEPVNWG